MMPAASNKTTTQLGGNPDHWAIVPCSEKWDEQTYQTAREQLIEYVSGIPDVHTVIEYGSVSTPGISDIDIIIGVSDEPASGIQRALAKTSIPPHVQAVIGHASLMIMPCSTLPQMKTWDAIQTQIIYGAEIDFLEFPECEFEIARIVDWLPERICRIYELFQKQALNERKTLGLLKSTAFSIEAVQQFVKLKPSAHRLLEDIAVLRSSWFDLPEPRLPHLLELLETTRIVALEAWLAFTTFLESGQFYGDPIATEESVKLEFPQGIVYHFAPYRQPNNGRDKLEILSWRGEKLFFTLPRTLERHFNIYARQRGLIGDALHLSMTPRHKNDDPAEELPDVMISCLQRRMELCNQWAAFLDANDIRQGLFKFGWFFPVNK